MSKDVFIFGVFGCDYGLVGLPVDNEKAKAIDMDEKAKVRRQGTFIGLDVDTQNGRYMIDLTPNEAIILGACLVDQGMAAKNLAEQDQARVAEARARKGEG